MELTIIDRRGRRKYLIPVERKRFLQAALKTGGKTASFCAVLALSGARISEVLALTFERIDKANSAITFETLKRRRRGVFRTVPVPAELIVMLEREHQLEKAKSDPVWASERLWTWSRSTAWRRVRGVMTVASNPSHVSQPKALRHAFGAAAVLEGVALGMVQKWLGHADIRTTVGYTTAVGNEERAIARRTWRHLGEHFEENDL